MPVVHGRCCLDPAAAPAGLWHTRSARPWRIAPHVRWGGEKAS